MTFKLGIPTINRIWLGAAEIRKAYLGPTPIHDNTVVPAFPTLVGLGASASGAAGQSPGWPAGHATGDCGILLQMAKANENTMATPVGFTSIGTNTPGSTSSYVKSREGYRVATSGSESAPACADTGSFNMARIVAFRGVGAVPTLVGTADKGQALSGSATLALDVTTTANNAAVLLVLDMYNGVGTAAVAAPVSISASGVTFSNLAFAAATISSGGPYYIGRQIWVFNRANAGAVPTISIEMASGYACSLAAIQIPH